jgi:Haem-binding domain
MKKFLKRASLALIVILIGVQFIPIEKTNPPERGDPPGPAEVQALLRRACFDCHSNETKWPWYAQIAPASLLIAQDVKEGRKEVNFSIWEKFDEKRKAKKLKEIAKEVGEGDMPLFYYLPLHPDAKLSPAERELIVKWAKPN